MTENPESLAETLSKVSNLDDLQAALPPTLTLKLGEGEKGAQRAMGMLIGLTPFAPNGTFDRSAFNAIVAFDYDSDEPLPPEEDQKMLDVGLESGLLTQVEGRAGARYKFDPKLQTMERLLKE